MKQPTWKCLECGKEFGVGDWTCVDGVTNHRVEEKQYRCTDAPTDPGRPENGGMDSLRDGTTTVCNIPPGKRAVVNGESRLEGEGSVVFVRGRFSTSNPEQQYWLDMKPTYNATEDEWRAAWLSTSQKQQLKEMELNALAKRLEIEKNDLLAQTQSRVKSKEAVAAH